MDQVQVSLEILSLVRKIKAEQQCSVKAPIEVLIIEGFKLSQEMIQEIKPVTMATTITFEPTSNSPLARCAKGERCQIGVLF